MAAKKTPKKNAKKTKSATTAKPKPVTYCATPKRLFAAIQDGKLAKGSYAQITTPISSGEQYVRIGNTAYTVFEGTVASFLDAMFAAAGIKLKVADTKPYLASPVAPVKPAKASAAK